MEWNGMEWNGMEWKADGKDDAFGDAMVSGRRLWRFEKKGMRRRTGGKERKGKEGGRK
jgi:hypothetical protein